MPARVSIQTAFVSTARQFSSTSAKSLVNVHSLSTWDLDTFRKEAFQVSRPVKLPSMPNEHPPAMRKWFVHDGKANYDLQTDTMPLSSELRTSFWTDFENTLVPLELTSRLGNDVERIDKVKIDESTETPPPPPPPSQSQNASKPQTSFHRTHAPLKLLLTYLAKPSEDTCIHDRPPGAPSISSIYLAQSPLPSLPGSLQADVPTPTVVTQSGRGDLYDSSLWLGRPPTYTPLHRDPNPNLLLQLCGRKVVRLFPPDVGDWLFDLVQQRIGAEEGRGRLRGEEMMQGLEREVLDRIVWSSDGHGGLGRGRELVSDRPGHADDGIDYMVHVGDGTQVLEYAQEVELRLGEALFIPKGWWHSVKGVGEGVTASVNWWFR